MPGEFLFWCQDILCRKMAPPQPKLLWPKRPLIGKNLAWPKIGVRGAVTGKNRPALDLPVHWPVFTFYTPSGSHAPPAHNRVSPSRLQPFLAVRQGTPETGPKRVFTLKHPQSFGKRVPWAIAH